VSVAGQHGACNVRCNDIIYMYAGGSSSCNSPLVSGAPTAINVAVRSVVSEGSGRLFSNWSGICFLFPPLTCKKLQVSQMNLFTMMYMSHLGNLAVLALLAQSASAINASTFAGGATSDTYPPSSSKYSIILTCSP
jgi:hypothetical protein